MPDLLTTREATEYLRCHETTLRRHWRAWGLTAIRLGPRGSLRFPLSSLERWVDRSVEKATPAARRPRPRRVRASGDLAKDFGVTS